ncbi:MAG: response regulator transcription factor [Muribaculaceae bacterium]
MDKHRILVVDDEDTLCEALRLNLEIEGYDVAVAHSAEEALTMRPADFSLILLDVMMDGMDGFKMAKMLKDNSATAEVPIIFCTARDTEDDMIAGLNLGADDYISKPYSIRNILARVRAVLKRTASQRHGDTVLRHEGLELDTSLKRCSVDGHEVALPRKEFEILHLLLSNPGHIFSREEILSKVWPEEVVVLNRVVDVNITRLRSKLGAYGKKIVTRSGYGYGFKD